MQRTRQIKPITTTRKIIAACHLLVGVFCGSGNPNEYKVVEAHIEALQKKSTIPRKQETIAMIPPL